VRRSQAPQQWFIQAHLGFIHVCVLRLQPSQERGSTCRWRDPSGSDQRKSQSLIPVISQKSGSLSRFFIASKKRPLQARAVSI
jgi:hypothetical protein